MRIEQNSFFVNIHTRKNAFWRYLLTFALVILAGMTATLVVGGALMMVEGTTDFYQFSDIGFLLVAMLPNLAMLAALWLALRLLHGCGLVSLISPQEPPRWRWALLSAGVWFGLAALADLVGYALDPQNYTITFDAARLLPFLGLALLLTPIQTSFEELLFRGYLTQWTALLSRSLWAALIVPSVLFGLLHSANPEVGAYGYGWMMANYIGVGLLLGWVTLRSQGLELALGLHAANNLYALLVTFPSSALPTPALVTTHRYDARLGLLVLIISALLYVWIMRGVLNARRANFAAQQLDGEVVP